MNSSTILVTVWQLETMQNPSQTILLLGARPNWFRSVPFRLLALPEFNLVELLFTLTVKIMM